MSEDIAIAQGVSVDRELPSNKHGSVSREYHASFFSRFVFQWITPLMTAGYRRPLEESDIWTISPDRRVALHAGHLQQAFERRLLEGRSDPLIWSLHEVFKTEFWLAGISLCFGQLFQILAPLTIRYLIMFVSSASADSEGRASSAGAGISLSLILFLVQLGMTFGFCHGIYNGTVIGGEMRAALVSSIFQKTLRLPSISDPSQRGGTLNSINLVGIDTQAIQDVMMLFHMIWTGPLAIMVALAILFVNLTYSALGGLLLLVLGAWSVSTVSRFFSTKSQEIAAVRDDRSNLLEELLHAIRWIKISSSEGRFLKRIRSLRAQEIKSLSESLAVRNMFTVLAASLPTFGAMISFIIFSLTGHTLAAAEVFSSLAIYNCLRMPLQQLPFLVRMVASARISAARIEQFLSTEEPSLIATFDRQLEYAVRVENATFSWTASKRLDLSVGPGDSTDDDVDERHPLLEDPSADRVSQPNFQLQGVNLQASMCSLTAIVGEVASGKSSLLAALSGEMPQTGGKVTFRRERAYCSQNAWIMTGSVRENIAFGKPLNEDFYDKVVTACALKPDFKVLINGDLTKVGERGVTLSGGQKQRISLARAIYSDCETVLLDDPFSAVDADVGRHILHEAILGLLKEKCVFISTHRYDVLAHSENIIWMDQGRIKAQGSLGSLQERSEGISKLISSYRITDEKHDETLERNFTAEDISSDITTTVELPTTELTEDQIVKEESSVGVVTWRIYSTYLSASGWALPWLSVTVLVLFAQATGIFTTIWLSWWSSGLFGLPRSVYIGAYVALAVLQYVVQYVSDVAAYNTGLSTSEVLFERTFSRVLTAPASFFDSVPVGRLLGLFTSDVDALDNRVTMALKGFLGISAVVINVLVMIAIYLPPVAIAFPPIIVLVYLGTRYFRASARELTRYSAQFRGDAMARVHEAITGSSTIRAYGVQSPFIYLVESSIDRMNSPAYLNLANGPWLSMRGDLIGNLLILFTALLVVEYRQSISPAVAGLVLTYIITLAQPIPYLVQAAANLEDSMISVERLLHYSGIPREDDPPDNRTVSTSWASNPDIAIQDLTLRYRPSLPPVLQGITVNIPAGSRVAIVGRTGSGKSTILSALTRLTPVESGDIKVGNTSIFDVPISKLRASIRMIPQDPAIFAGTVRSNVDPDNLYPDEVLNDVLTRIGLFDPALDSSTTTSKTGDLISLSTSLPQHGSTLSQGQKQLLALSTVLLPPPPFPPSSAPLQSQILLLDEPTSSLPPSLSTHIHTLLHSRCPSKTIITIAHHLKSLITAANIDLVIVLDAGRIVETGRMKDLWDGTEGTGKFRDLCLSAGVREEDFA